MNLTEYEKVKNLTYQEYCDYLQKKYGIGLCDYFTKFWAKNSKVTRTKEGLIVHHKFEDHVARLSSVEIAIQNPSEWQKAENLVYCDYLEHLLLHILIWEMPVKCQNGEELLGIGGITHYIVPELNDLYSGWQAQQPWRKNCHNLVINDKKVYLRLLQRFKISACIGWVFDEDCLFTSLNEQYGGWSRKNNEKLFAEIAAL